MEQNKLFEGKHNRRQDVEESEESRGQSLITPKPLPNPVLESKERKELHRELLWNQRIGNQVLNTKTELQRVLQERRMQQQHKGKLQEDNVIPEFMQVHQRITSGNRSD